MGESRPLDIEEALEGAGNWGLYQKLLYALTFICGIPNAFIALHFVFSHYEPNHHCTLPDELMNFTTNNTEDMSKIIDLIIPKTKNEEGDISPDGCTMYNRNYSSYPVSEWLTEFNSTANKTNCEKGLDIDIGPNQDTAVIEYSMICVDDWKAPLATSVYHVGLAVGSICGTVADKYGRRPVFLAACLVQILSMIFTASSWDFASYCVAIFFSGVSGLVNYVIAFVLVTEVTGAEWRNFMAIGSTYSFSLGLCIIAGIGYIFQSWRWYIGVMTIISTLIYIPTYWLIPESPRWLAQTGRSEDAVRMLKMVAKINRRADAFDELMKTRGEKITSKSNITSAGMIESLRVLLGRGIRSRFLASVFAWQISSMMYYAITYYSSDFSKNRFVNVFLNGLTDLPGILIGFYCVKLIGRPRSMLLLMSICGLSSVTLPFIPKDLPGLITAIALIGKGAIAGVFYLAYLVSSEVVPTLQRSSSMSFCSAGARIGSFSAPYLMYIRKFEYFVPNLIMGVLAFSCGLVGIIFLPETKGVELPDTVEEARQNRRFYGWNLCRSFGDQSQYTEGKKESSFTSLNMSGDADGNAEA